MELVIDTLGLDRGGRAVLAGVSARAGSGEALVVTGPNGAGKSTLLRALAGFLRPATGAIRLTGGGRALPLGEHVAYAGHLDAIKPVLGVRQNLALWAGLSGADGARVDEALARFSLDRLAERPAAECSAGQRRRLGLARLLVCERAVWLMDEPTASLDAASAGVVSTLIEEHRAAGGIAVVATHLDLGLADPRTLRLSPTTAPARAPAAGEPHDPFLDGAW
ncbi:MAG: heme ABC exporter ATP-binding protein CcmA [Paracoccaceae bacterium]